MLPLLVVVILVLLAGVLLIRLATRSSRAGVAPGPGGRYAAEPDDATRSTRPTPPPAT